MKIKFHSQSFMVCLMIISILVIISIVITSCCPPFCPPVPDPSPRKELRRVPHDQEIFGDNSNVQIVSGIWHIDKAIVIGNKKISGTYSTTWKPIVWISSDGINWERIWEGNRGRMNKIISLGYDDNHNYRGLIAVGGTKERYGRPIIWESENGENWVEQVQLSAIGVINDIIYIGSDDIFLAVGHHEEAATVWTSNDGINWNEIEDDPRNLGVRSSENRFNKYMMNAVAKNSDGYVAVGVNFYGLGIYEHIPTFWYSDDGLQWTRTEDNSELQPWGRIWLTSVNPPTTSEMIAIGVADLSGGDKIMVYKSSDRQNWDLLNHDEDLSKGFGASMNAFRVWSGPLIGVGSLSKNACIWTFSQYEYDWSISNILELGNTKRACICDMFYMPGERNGFVYIGWAIENDGSRKVGAIWRYGKW